MSFRYKLFDKTLFYHSLSNDLLVNCKDNPCKSYCFRLEVLTVYIIYLLKFLLEYNDIYNDMTILGEICSISSMDSKRQIVVA